MESLILHWAQKAIQSWGIVTLISWGTVKLIAINVPQQSLSVEKNTKPESTQKPDTIEQLTGAPGEWLKNEWSLYKSWGHCLLEC